MKEKFRDARLKGSINIFMDKKKGYWEADKLDICQKIVYVCNQYQKDGDTLTLRQLYYQLVAQDWIPNHDKVYKRIGKIKDDLVYSGNIDWSMFEDRNRIPHIAYFENDVPGALERTIYNYALDRQVGQENHIEVWTEKDAISGILKTVTVPYTIRLVVNKGYTSSTAIYNAYRRFVSQMEKGKKIRVLYFGDHDPSGLDMIRDIRDRITMMFTNGDSLDDMVNEWWDNDRTLDLYSVADMEGYHDVAKLAQEESEKLEQLFYQGQRKLFLEQNDWFEIVPIGLTMDQIEKYNLPSNPAKMKDPRQKWYVQQFGPVSWEVDALSPKVMRSIVKDAIVERIDNSLYDGVLAQEKIDIEELTKMFDSIK